MSNVMKIVCKNRRIREMDFLRGFSIFTIVLMHLLMFYSNCLPNIIIKMSSWGGAGVHVFFLCSGLGLYLSHNNKPLEFLEFLRKRFLKIYIPYIVVVFISFLVPYMYDGNDRIVAFLSHVFLFKMFIPAYETSFGVHFWFISTIIQFYLVFNILCFLKKRMGNRKFLILSLFFSFSWWVLTFILNIADERIFGSFLLQYLWEFALGMVLADKFFIDGFIEIKKKYLWITAIIGTVAYGVLALSNETLKAFNDIPSMIGYVSIALLLCGIPLFRNVFTKISVYSYEWYLTHILIFTTAFQIIRPDTSLIGLFVGFLSFMLSIYIAKVYHMILAFFKRKHKRC